MEKYIGVAASLTLAGWFVAGAAEAQVVPTESDIRLWEQEGSSVAPIERRLYTTYFDARRTRTIGVEVTLNHARATASAIFPVDCALQRPDDSSTHSTVRLEVRVVTGADVSNGVTLWNRGESASWAPGTYKVRCMGRGFLLGEISFEISMNPPDAADTDLRVAGLRLFAANGPLPPRAERAYATRFDARKTARIGVELEFVHSPPGRTLSIPVDCYYFSPSGKPMGPISFSYDAPPDSAGGDAALALGWERPGQWPQGHYTAVCNIRGRPVAVERFAVD
jgi:hypothetical protein